MKMTFPHMGNPIIYKKLIELLGHEIVCPNKPTKKTIELGVKHSPEFACFPMKAIMGTYIESLERGANVIVTSGGHGPCRAGFYGEVHKKILNNMAYDVEFIVFDSIHKDFKGFMRNMMKLVKCSSPLKVYKSLRLVYKITKDIDYFEKIIQTKRAYEINKGQCSRALEEIIKLYDQVKDNKDLKKAKKTSQHIVDNISIKYVEEDFKIRIGIVGEIYVVMESSVNMKIEEVLASLGCEVRRSHYLSDWADHNIVPKIFRNDREDEILKKGEPYIEVQIGGHAKETLGHIVDYKEKGFDGIIHLLPFGCLPELVSQSIIPRMSREINMPILSIALDEQSGLANNLTRIEAFIDIIKTKKKRKIVS
ncbi:MAG: CoA protein activase [Anaeromicrobium sp.]|uniref:CoA protein activase n=1 Tax=Anaeromicrobium sp. TaxID=1929132 RepID=UPI0025FAC334|nr:CoA protein activase [Anaeromicrobium sp.]MCT4595071.1 CoA protein activase [Anaeromicrobium sp.]